MDCYGKGKQIGEGREGRVVKKKKKRATGRRGISDAPSVQRLGRGNAARISDEWTGEKE